MSIKLWVSTAQRDKNAHQNSTHPLASRGKNTLPAYTGARLRHIDIVAIELFQNQKTVNNAAPHQHRNQHQRQHHRTPSMEIIPCGFHPLHQVCSKAPASVWISLWRALEILFTKLIAVSSSTAIRLSTRRLMRLCASITGIATPRPNMVVTSASEIPEESMHGSPVPWKVISSKVWIIPVTVPRSPKSGAIEARTARVERKRSCAGISAKIASCKTFSSSARGWLTKGSPALNTRAGGTA